MAKQSAFRQRMNVKAAASDRTGKRLVGTGLAVVATSYAAGAAAAPATMGGSMIPAAVGVVAGGVIAHEGAKKMGTARAQRTKGYAVEDLARRGRNAEPKDYLSPTERAEFDRVHYSQKADYLPPTERAEFNKVLRARERQNAGFDVANKHYQDSHMGHAGELSGGGEIVVHEHTRRRAAPRVK